MLDVIKDETSDKLYLKTFLLDREFNKTDTLNPEYIPKHVNRFVGKPYIITPRRYFSYQDKKVFAASHPEEFDNPSGPYGYFDEAQNKYTAGYIRRIEPDRNHNNADDHRYLAYVEITDPRVRSAFEQGNIPKYVSAAVYSTSRSPDKPNEIRDFEPLHLAAVDIPMSGIDRAIIRGSCVGTESTCTRNLAAASITSADKTEIAQQLTQLTQEQKFHDAQVLREIADGYRYSSYVDKPGTNPLEKLAESTTNASTNINDAQSQPQPSQSTNTVSPSTQPTATITNTTDSNSIPFTIAPNTSGQGQPFSVKSEEVKPAEGNQPGQIGGVKAATAEERNSNNNNNNKDELAELRAQYAELKNMVAPLVEFKQNTEKAETERKTAEKKAMLESVIPEDYANSTEEREKAIASLMKIDGSELDYIVDKFVVPLTGSSPCGGNVKQAGRSGGGGCADKTNDNPITKKRTLSRLTDYAKPNTNQSKVAQAGITGDNGNAVDDTVTSRILSMTRVVNSSRLSGGWR